MSGPATLLLAERDRRSYAAAHVSGAAIPTDRGDA
jgi:hypothetical protein